MKTFGFYLLICLPVLMSLAQHEGTTKVTLTLRPERTPVYIGDKVTMECRVEDSITDLTYRFHKVGNGHNYEVKQTTERTYTIESVSQSDSGEYQCDVYRAGYSQVLAPSNRVKLTVHELFSNPTLTVHPNTTFWEGDTVTLRCQSESRVQETRLRYKFYRDQESVSQTVSVSEFRIPSARPEKSGNYWCEVEEEGKKTEKKTSERVQVTVREHPKATLTLRRHRDVVYTGDTVTMDCRIDDSFTGWRYQWYRGNVAYRGSPIKDVTGPTYTIQSVTQSDSGPYWCEAHRADPPHRSRPSNAVTLTVKELFSKPSLKVDPKTSVWEGDAVTLRCQSESRVQETRLRYKFYKDKQPVSQRASESEFTIPSARPEKSGSYWCEVEAEGKEIEKKTSERVQVTVRGHPKARLTLQRQRDVMYTGDTVIMDCSIDGSFTGWRYQWYRGNVANRGSPTKDVTGPTYTIQSVTQSDSGPYWCKAHRDDPPHHTYPSNAVNLSVNELFTKPTLTVHPSTKLWQGDAVTLRCQSESQVQSTRLRYKFYRDEEPVSERLSESEFTIPSARPEKSGSYWCEVEAEGKKTEKKTSERVQVTVRESSPFTIICILRASLFLLMLLPVLVVYRMTEGFLCFDCKKARKEQKGMYVNAPGGGTVQMEAFNEGEDCITSNNDGLYDNI